MNPSYDFQGQVAFVTGASSGMGLATARAFAGQGAAIALADVDEGALRTATHDLAAAGHRALGVICDVTDEAQVARAVERTVETFGRLDMAFNNAGIMLPPSGARRRRALGPPGVTPPAPAPPDSRGARSGGSRSGS